MSAMGWIEVILFEHSPTGLGWPRRTQTQTCSNSSCVANINFENNNNNKIIQAGL